jgi:chaperonin GroES
MTDTLTVKKTRKKLPDNTGLESAVAAKPADRTPIPTQDRVLVTRVKPEAVSAGGIIIPEMAVEDETKGYVIAVGPTVGKTERTMVPAGEPNRFPQPGDLVYFGQYAGVTLNHDGKEYLMMRESDIMAILP